jgi:hypothetical protein
MLQLCILCPAARSKQGSLPHSTRVLHSQTTRRYPRCYPASAVHHHTPNSVQEQLC